MSVPPVPYRSARRTHDDGDRRPPGTLHAMFRWFDNPFPEESEPQRLLALAAVRREIIEKGLGLTGTDADLVAFGPVASLHAKLTEPDLTRAQRDLLIVGLISVGQRDSFGLLLDTFSHPPSDLALAALRLVLPFPRRVRRSSDPAMVIDWFKRHYRSLKWDAQSERYAF